MQINQNCIVKQKDQNHYSRVFNRILNHKRLSGGGVLSDVAVYDLLKTLESSGYADDIAIRIRVKFENTVSDHSDMVQKESHHGLHQAKKQR